MHFGFVLLFLYAPIVVLMVLSFNESGQPFAWGGFSVRWYEQLFGDREIWSAVLNTLIVGGAATVIATAIGTLLALGLERTTSSTVLDAAVYVPMIIPDIVLAIALLSFYNLVFSGMMGLQLGLWSVVISHVVFNIAFVAAVVRTRLRHFDRSVEEASLDLGATPVRTFRSVTLPIIAPGVIAGAMIAFTLSIDEFVIAFFTAGTAVTFPIRIYSMIRFGVTPEINAIATLVVIVSIVLVIAAQRLRREEEP